jgi:flagellar hook-length control protein FliK
MTVSPLASLPMIGRAADTPATATPGTGFGDLLNVLGGQPAAGGQGGTAPTATLPDLDMTPLADPFAEADTALPAVASEAPAPLLPGEAEASSAVALADSGKLPVEPAPVPTPDGSQLAAAIDPKASAVADTGQNVSASPVVARPHDGAGVAPQTAAADEMPATSPTDPLLDPLHPQTAPTGGDTKPQLADTTTPASPATVRPRPARQAGADALPASQSAAPVAEAVVGASAPTPRDTVAGVRSAGQDDRGKTKAADRASARDDSPALAAADPASMPLATPLIQPASGHPKLTDANAAAPGQDTDSPIANATSPAGASVPQSAEASTQPPQPGQDNLPSLLASQTPAGPITRSMPIAQPYAAAPNVPAQPVIAAQPGRIGRDMGVEIARQVSAGRQEVLVRLDPAEMGRIDVRLSFDDKGHLHAAMSADSPAALDMLRRDAGDLGRALAGAGIQADPSTFRFDSRGSDAGQFAQHQQHGGQRDSAQDRDGGGRRNRDDANLAAMPASYRQLRTSSRVDLTA